MAVFEFKEEEIFRNRMKTNPSYHFTVYLGNVYINHEIQDSGSFNAKALCVPEGYISLYEINVDKLSGSNNYVYPFITKGSSLYSFASITTSSFFSNFAYGDILTGSYPMSSSLYRNYYVTASAYPVNASLDSNADQIFYQRKHIYALKNTLDHYKTLSEHYEYNGAKGDKSKQELSLISIPSIFYGSSIKKGSVNLKFYVTGTLVGELTDKNKNGELIQTGPAGSTGSGSVAGVVLYTEGFLLLTGSWDLSNVTDNYINESSNLKKPQWRYFGAGINGFDYGTGVVSSSHCEIYFQGTHYINTVTMFAHAPQGYCNHSNNPTYIDKTSGHLYQLTVNTGSSKMYLENKNLDIENVTHTPYKNVTGSFKKTTFISQVGIYDEHMNLIGTAKVAKPVKKTEDREFTFKLKLDI
tara:strand:- start:91 stop:1326 length:1236 start_codon:yes stop_codon:yes gene_type:complete